MMKLFDTGTRAYVDWNPDTEVRMYVCGITPYDSAHLGHIFTFMTYDLLQRRLESQGHELCLVRNITDVDEPIYKRAAEIGIAYNELAAEETRLFQDVMRRLNFRPPAHEPKASDYVLEMADAVRRLKASGHAYHVDADIYFDTAKDPQFGKFSGFHEGLLNGLMKKRGGDPLRPGKRHPLDFLLWKAVPDVHDTAAWETDLGRGRPGWHIECSVMSSGLLGSPFTIHGGGNDLIFPHHECEIAQSRALGSPVMAQYWMHVAAILYGGEKMSKSLGNLVFAADLLDHYSPGAIRLALMHYHYREGGEWIPRLLDEAAELLTRLDQAAAVLTPAGASSLYAEVCAALDDDLDTHAVVHLLQDVADGSYRPIDSQSSDNKALADTLQLLGLTS